MKIPMIELAVNDRGDSAVMESLKRARQKAGIRDADIKPAARKYAKQMNQTPGSGTMKKTVQDTKRIESTLRILITRAEYYIGQLTKRKRELEAELDNIRRSIGPYSMTATLKRQQITKVDKQISELQKTCADCKEFC